MTISTAIQQALYDKLTTSQAVIALVPMLNILDRNSDPKADPLILIGEDQITDDGSDLRRNNWRVYSTLHVWKVENSTAGVKAITGAILKAVQSGNPDLGDDYQCIDWRVSSSRFIRDPDGIHSHAIITIDSLISEVMQ